MTRSARTTAHEGCNGNNDNNVEVRWDQRKRGDNDGTAWTYGMTTTTVTFAGDHGEEGDNDEVRGDLR